MKKFLIPCKTQESLEEMKKIFGNNENLEIILMNEEKICGYRAHGVLVTNEWTCEEWKNLLFPYIVAPMDLRERIKANDIKRLLISD